jgi:DNA polymerase
VSPLRPSVLDRALEEAGIDRSQVYLTNAVKHFNGRQFRVTKQRGELIESPWAEYVTATIHPSAILRAEDRDAAYAGFLGDLKKVAKLL